MQGRNLKLSQLFYCSNYCLKRNFLFEQSNFTLRNLKRCSSDSVQENASDTPTLNIKNDFKNLWEDNDAKMKELSKTIEYISKKIPDTFITEKQNILELFRVDLKKMFKDETIQMVQNEKQNIFRVDKHNNLKIYSKEIYFAILLLILLAVLYQTIKITKNGEDFKLKEEELKTTRKKNEEFKLREEEELKQTRKKNEEFKLREEELEKTIRKYKEIEDVEKTIRENQDRISELKREHEEYLPLPWRSTREGIRKKIDELKADNKTLQDKSNELRNELSDDEAQITLQVS